MSLPLSSSSSFRNTRAPKHNLTEEQLAEIKKVFSICDKDGDGSISAKELKFVMEKLAGSTPTPAEIDHLMSRMDTNNDGVIQWDEFVNALSDWLDEEEKSEVRVGSKRKEAPTAPEQARAKIHKRISMFFLQFNRSANFDEIRKKLSMLTREYTDDASLMDDDTASPVATPQDKAEKVETCRKLLESIPQMAVGINSNDPNVAINCVKAVAEMLSIVDTFKTPQERYEIGELVVTLFARIKEASIVARVAKFLEVLNMPELQFEAARVITYYAPGPRIAHTPRDSILHPDKLLHKTEVIHSGAVPTLVQLLQSPCLEVREQSALALGKIASHHPEARDFVLSLGAFPRLYTQITDSTPLSLLRKLTWTLCVLCGHTHPPDRPPPYKVVSEALPKFAYLLFYLNDEETLINICVGLSYLLPGLLVDDGIVQRLCTLLRYPSVRVQRAILRALIDLARFDDVAIQKLLASDILGTLLGLVTSTKEYTVKMEVTEMVATIVEKGHIQAIIDSNILPALMGLLNDDFARWKVVKVLAYCTRSIPAHVAALVEKLDIVRVLSNSLMFFKAYDSVLRDVYQFLGPSYNFRFVQEILESLENVLNVGELVATGNPFVTKFDMDVVDKIRGVMLMLSEGEAAEQLDAWRNAEKANNQSLDLEERIKTLLLKIKTSHERARTNGHEVIGKNITSALATFTENMKKTQARLKKKRSTNSSEEKHMSVDSEYGRSRDSMNRLEDGEKMTAKVFFGGDNRLIDIPKNPTLSDLSLRIQLKFGKPLVIQYEDEDGDKITLDSKELLQKALARADANSGTLKLYLLDPQARAGSIVADSKVDLSGMNAHQQKAFLLNQMESTTHFSRKDLESLYQQFQKTSINGRVNRAQFEQGLRACGVTDRVMIDQFFTAFDDGKDGFIDFREFVTGLSVMYRGTMEERLELAFRAYDLDGNGWIDRDELFQILKASFHARGFQFDDETIRNVHVEKCFQECDLDGDGRLDLQEFKQAALHNQIMVQSFWKSPLQ